MEQIDLIPILKDHIGETFYSTVYGEVRLEKIEYKDEKYPFIFRAIRDDGEKTINRTTSYGLLINNNVGECTLFPSKTERNWKKWDKEHNKREEHKFKPFEKVLVRDTDSEEWRCTFYSHFNKNADCPYDYGHVTATCTYAQCIPYEGNEDLVGTNKTPE